MSIIPQDSSVMALNNSDKALTNWVTLSKNDTNARIIYDQKTQSFSAINYPIIVIFFLIIVNFFLGKNKVIFNKTKVFEKIISTNNQNYQLYKAHVTGKKAQPIQSSLIKIERFPSINQSSSNKTISSIRCHGMYAMPSIRKMFDYLDKIFNPDDIYKRIYTFDKTTESNDVSVRLQTFDEEGICRNVDSKIFTIQNTTKFKNLMDYIRMLRDHLDFKKLQEHPKEFGKFKKHLDKTYKAHNITDLQDSLSEAMKYNNPEPYNEIIDPALSSILGYYLLEEQICSLFMGSSRDGLLLKKFSF